MAVFRVERTRDYTVMSNHHLKNRTLSLKAKGLLSLMLSLPEDWDYTTRGLASICREGVDATGKALKELETAGYIVRNQLRGKDGRISDTEYIIYEQPHKFPGTPLPNTDSPDTENPYLDKPDMVQPYTDNQAQLNTNRINIPKRSNTHESITQSFFPSTPSADRLTDVFEKRQDIRVQIEYDAICTPINREQIDEFVELMLEVNLSHSSNIKIGRDMEYPTALVQDRFRKLTSAHIVKILDSIRENNTRVRNTKAYLLAALFNAPSSTDNHYTMQVNHDLYHDSSRGR